MIKSYNFTKKDEINSSSSTPVQNVKGEKVTLVGAAITSRPDLETGEEKEVGLLSTTEYGVLSTISPSAIKSLNLIIDYLEETKEADVKININVGKSKGGREFITLTID